MAEMYQRQLQQIKKSKQNEWHELEWSQSTSQPVRQSVSQSIILPFDPRSNASQSVARERECVSERERESKRDRMLHFLAHRLSN